ncbi:MAG: hypothetical protein JKY03_01645 [Aureispira sp.]|nr:hypothetical protein [Aureispira sp.]
MKTYHFEDKSGKNKNFESNLYSMTNKSFLLLGSDLNTHNDEIVNELKLKTKKKSLVTPETIWGTLGWKNKDKKLDLKGNIQFSEYGTHHYKENQNKQIRNIWTINPLSKSNDFSVLERTINLDETLFEIEQLKCTYQDIPALRLTLFTQPGEAAIVYYEHQSKDTPDDTSPLIEFILRQEKKESDRQDYYIPITPKFKIDYDEASKKLILDPKEEKTSFTIKILTFKRHDLIAGDLFNEAKNQINLWTKEKQMGRMSGPEMIGRKDPRPISPYLGDSKYALWIFDADDNEFQSIPLIKNRNRRRIDFNKKTLLLLHGTFSNTCGSYGKLYGEDGTVLKELIKDGHYEQIISFDHPTISRDVFDNSKELYRLIGTNKFSESVDILGYSRGGLFSKWLASDEDNPIFKVGKILNFSPAKGVGYFEKAEYLEKLLSVLQYFMPSAVGKLITFFVQESAEFFLELPGCRQMTPGSKRLDKVLKADFKYPSTTLKNIVADWNVSLRTNFFSKLNGQSLDIIVKYFLGSKHDWVVGFEGMIVRLNTRFMAGRAIGD